MISQCSLSSHLKEFRYFINASHLQNEGFAAPARCGTNHTHIICFHDEIFKPVKNASTGRRNTSMNTTLIDWLTGDTSMRIDIQMTYVK